MLERDKWNIGLKLENSQFPRDLRGKFFQFVPETYKYPPFYIYVSNIPSTLKIEQKTLKSYVLQQISIESLNVAPLPHQNFRQSLKFYYTPYSDIIKVGFAKISF